MARQKIVISRQLIRNRLAMLKEAKAAYIEATEALKSNPNTSLTKYVKVAQNEAAEKVAKHNTYLQNRVIQLISENIHSDEDLGTFLEMLMERFNVPVSFGNTAEVTEDDEVEV
jgi:hypothetical protein